MQKVEYTKPFLSHHAQISLLKSRGMKFANETKALHLLKRIGYYRLSVYWRRLLADKKYYPRSLLRICLSLCI